MRAPAVPMLDDHTGVVSPHHRALLVWSSGDFARIAVCTEDVMSRWVGHPAPVHSLCEAIDGEVPRITRTDHLTITGVQLATLYSAGAVTVGRADIRLVEGWAADVCACGHLCEQHHAAPLCACGHPRLAHHSTVKDGVTHLPTGCGRVSCPCAAYRPEGPPVRTYCLAAPSPVHFCPCKSPEVPCPSP